MINVIWMGLLLTGMIVSAIHGNSSAITEGIIEGAKSGVTVSFGLLSFLMFWMGMMKIADKAGLVAILAKFMRPIAKLLYPSVPIDHPAMGSILANMSANLLGLGNAATPFGLKAMSQLQELNPDKTVASDAMCTLLAINTAGVTLIPAGVIALRSMAGASNSTDIVVPTILATFCGTVVAVFLDRLYRRLEQRKGRTR